MRVEPKHEPEVIAAKKIAKLLAWLFEDERPGEARRRFLYLCELNPNFRVAFKKRFGIDPVTGKR